MELESNKKLVLIPITLMEANEFVKNFHRHNDEVKADKFSIGASFGGDLVGVAIVSHPVARLMSHGGFTAEVRRTCTIESAPKGTVSFLYAACWRAWRAMGGLKMITYTLATESGASLRGAGWKCIGEIRIRKWDMPNRERRWQPIYGQQKLRWEVTNGTD